MFAVDHFFQDADQPTTKTVLVADAQRTRQAQERVPRIGICVISPTHEQIRELESRHSISKSISPRMDAENHFAPKDNKWRGFEPQFIDENRLAKVNVREMPKHGQLVAYRGEMGNDFAPGTSVDYIPKAGYTGKDRLTVLVSSQNGLSIIFSYYIYVTPAAGKFDLYNDSAYKKYCPGGLLIWKISETSSSDPAVGAFSVEPAGAWIAIDEGLASAFSFADLPDFALGHTTGTGFAAEITLDTDAAGHGWFVDNTPWGNEEFLPTSNPGEWVARPGSAADGRIDLLTVLLHEQGHALGLEHSADPHHFMAATLTPGMRRTLSAADQLALLQLAGHLPPPDSSGDAYSAFSWGAPLPFTRVTSLAHEANPSRAAGTEAAANRPQLHVAANPRLESPTFSGGSGWSTAGDVRFSDGAATLLESPDDQTRLNQVFVLGDTDHFLSFTLADIGIGDQLRGPDDAFELALVDANTGLALLRAGGLTRSDAALNRQADGSEARAGEISVTRNADGSVRYLIDLRGIAAGTVLNLTFDLIGFASTAGDGAEARNSRVTIRDLHLGADPQAPRAQDDAATTAEDVPLRIDVLANDSGVAGVSAVELVAAPANGTVVANADGSLLYQPAPDWHGDDRFSYRLRGVSGMAAQAEVRLTVTPVNDPPRLAELAVSLPADGTIVLDLPAMASDADGDPLTLTAGTPQHGSLAPMDDGRYAYRPAADHHGDDSFAIRVSDGATAVDGLVRLTITAVNDAPLARDHVAELDEDGQLTLELPALGFDADGDPLTLAFTSQPAHGTLSRDAQGRLVYTPAADWGGRERFTYTLGDGTAESQPATVLLAVTPLGDAPALLLGGVPGGQRELFRTSWESVANPDTAATLLHEATLEGWRSVGQAVDRAEAGNGFRIWSTGDHAGGLQGRDPALRAGAGNGSNWLELGGGDGDARHAVAIERAIETIAGARYTLALDLAGRPGQAAEQSRITLSVDGREIGTAAASSPAGSLAWQSQRFDFVGSGGRQMIRLAHTARGGTGASGVAMIDDIVLDEAAPGASGRADTAIALPALRAALTDRDGSETLRLTIAGIPAGATLGDGEHHFGATANTRVVDVSEWDLARLSLRPPRDFVGTLQLDLVATAHEQSNRSEATSRARIEVQVQPANAAPTARDARFAVAPGARVRIDLRALVADGDGDALALAVTDPAHGELIDEGDGSWIYLAGTRFAGSDRFRYTVADGSSAASATISLTLAPTAAVPQPPAAAGDGFDGQPEVDAAARQPGPLVQEGPAPVSPAATAPSMPAGEALRQLPVATTGAATMRPRADSAAVPAAPADEESPPRRASATAGEAQPRWWLPAGSHAASCFIHSADDSPCRTGGTSRNTAVVAGESAGNLKSDSPQASSAVPSPVGADAPAGRHDDRFDDRQRRVVAADQPLAGAGGMKTPSNGKNGPTMPPQVSRRRPSGGERDADACQRAASRAAATAPATALEPLSRGAPPRGTFSFTPLLADCGDDAPGPILSASPRAAGAVPNAEAPQAPRLPPPAPVTAGTAAAAAAPRIDWSASHLRFAAPHRAPPAWLPAFLGTRPSASTLPNVAALTIRIDA